MKESIAGILISEERIRDKVAEMAQTISRDFEGRDPLVVSVLKGSYMFMADLTRRITVPCTIDFMAVSSYGSGSKSSGEVKIIKDLDRKIEGRHLLIVEDILDSGLTLSYLMELLRARNPASISLCAFLNKPDRRKADVRPDYCGFDIPDAFVVGYGLDYDEHFRNLPYVGILAPEVYGGKE